VKNKTLDGSHSPWFAWIEMIANHLFFLSALILRTLPKELDNLFLKRQ
jgi:hypothetical protein